MCLLDILASLRATRRDLEPSVLLGDDGPLRAAVEGLGVPCRVLPLPAALAGLGDANLSGGGRLGLAARAPAAAAALAGYLAALRRALRELAPDRLHTNGMKAHVLGAWAAPRRLPLVWHLHDYLGSRAVMARLLRASTRPGLVGVAVSRSVAEDSVRVLGPRVPVLPIYNAVDLDRFAPGPGPAEGAALDRAAGWPETPEGTVRVGLVATFARWKGHEVFLRAVALTRPAALVRYYLVGGPIYRSVGSQYGLDELKGLADALGVSGRVGFVGHQADPAAAIRGLDVVVHASTRPEPFGRVIVEGMACGRAVIAARGGGASELFDDGRTALGCPPGDPEALARAIERLAGDPGLRASLGAAGRRAAESRFDRSGLAERWAQLYEAADGDPAMAGGPIRGTEARQL